MSIVDIINQIDFMFQHNIDFKNFKFENHTLDLTNYDLSCNSVKKDLVFRNKNYEIFLIKWRKGNFIDKHKHPRNGCHLKILEGKVKEVKYKYHHFIIQESNYLSKNMYSFSAPEDIHSIEALEDSVSLHIYSPPLFYDK
jgi:cysteine dioxygenase